MLSNSVSSMTPFQLFPLGDAAIVVQLGQTIDPDIHNRISAFTAYLSTHTFTGFVELVPAYASITVYYDPWIVSKKGKIDPYQKVVEVLQKRLVEAPTNNIATRKIVEIPVCYGGDFGPDLDFVASHNKLSFEDVISLHSLADYKVYMIGFAPGFPYLGGLDAKIATPRKETPRAAIPAGSVGIAGLQTGIYPLETPGGWQLIGRTPERLFDPEREKPAMLQAGDQVKFVSITEAEFKYRKDIAT